MPTPDLTQQIRGLRAIRAYTADPLGEDVLEEILESGRWTGSSLNSQPWTFVVVTDAGSKRALSEAGQYATHLASAPAVIVLVGAPGRGGFDLGRAAQNMMLTAATLGVGSCPATLHDEESVRRLLAIPDDCSARHAVAFGHPDQDLERVVRANMKIFTGSARRPLEDVFRRETYE